MTGATGLVRTAVQAGVSVCFANPGTTELDIVRAFDETPGARAILCLFEGVATGAADGYARMTDVPGMTLLHLGAGLGNGVANLHNARKARSRVVNIVGDHDVDHIPHNSPLTSDIQGIARPVSDWVRTADSTEDVSADIAAAIEAVIGPAGGVATLVAPADILRSEGGGPTAVLRENGRAPVFGDVAAVADALGAGPEVALLLSGRALTQDGLVAGARIAEATGCALMHDSSSRIERGAGLPNIHGFPGTAAAAAEHLPAIRAVVLAGASPPVTFFKWPGEPSSRLPKGVDILTLATPEQDAVPALLAVADAVGAGQAITRTVALDVPSPPTGELSVESAGRAIAAALPEGAIVADESITSGGPFNAHSRACPRHTRLSTGGGSIGWALPQATGAAVACPDRPVIALSGDGGAMYTIQALWTQAREGLNVTSIIWANREYAILRGSLRRFGVDPIDGASASLTDLRSPNIDWVQLARSMGVPGSRPETAEDTYDAIARAIAEPGPHLIEVVV
ncbi:acetolactate synthase large subunit [Candidatus Poribacteria bacterium]|nr:acetolactate synthase large subunit [Candidatus Poribacteria bacterium]